MKRYCFIIFSFIVLTAISLAFTKKDPGFKNLKILPKNITQEQLDSVMTHYSLSLGVRCNFCHVLVNEQSNTWDFPSDNNKHKLVTREMMIMTQKINDKFFAVADTKSLNAQLLVTCFTCHHGSNEPVTKPPLPPMEQKPPADSLHRQGIQDSTRNNL